MVLDNDCEYVDLFYRKRGVFFLYYLNYIIKMNLEIR